MDFKYLILICVLTLVVKCSSATGVWTLIHDSLQNNIVGAPIIHQHTEWDFDPEDGKQRRARFEALNGHLGMDLIARLGMGMDFKGPWGKKVSNQPKPDLRYNA